MAWQTIQTALQVIYPTRCLGCGDLVETAYGLCPDCWRDTPFIGGLVCDCCGLPLPGFSDRRETCDGCLRQHPPWKRGRAALLYQGQARKLVMALKHGDRQEIARPAAGWMLAAARPLLQPDMLLAPVPLHWQRMLKRRFNQAALLSEAIARLAGLEHCPDLLLRQKATKSTAGQNRRERHAEMQNAFRAHPDRLAQLRGRHLLLIDDVMTSGATLSACSRVALANGARQVSVLVLARAGKAPYISGQF